MKIERTLFWFVDGNDQLTKLNVRFFGYGTLLNRLLNEKYDGKRIQFININFLNSKAYELRPGRAMNSLDYYGGHLNYYGIIDLEEFNLLSEEGQDYFIWQRAYEYLQVSAEQIKNNDLLIASQYAYNKGLTIKLNLDFKAVESDVTLYGQRMKAAIWILFKGNGMFSKFTLDKNGTVIFEKDIDKSSLEFEPFLEIYKGIEVNDNTIIIKGVKYIPYLPLQIPIDEKLINGLVNL